MQFDREYIEKNRSFSSEGETLSELFVIRDQVLEFFKDKVIPSQEEELALSYAQKLYDLLFFQLFKASPLGDPNEKRIDMIKKWIQIKWGSAREIPKGEIYSDAFKRF